MLATSAQHQSLRIWRKRPGGVRLGLGSKVYGAGMARNSDSSACVKLEAHVSGNLPMLTIPEQ